MSYKFTSSSSPTQNYNTYCKHPTGHPSTIQDLCTFFFFFNLHKYHLLIKVIKPSTSHRNNLDGTPEVTSQNSSFNYLIIRIIIIIIIALMVTFLCIIRKLIMELSCFAVGRSYPSFNACYLLFGALL